MWLLGCPWKLVTSDRKLVYFTYLWDDIQPTFIGVKCQSIDPKYQQDIHWLVCFVGSTWQRWRGAPCDGHEICQSIWIGHNVSNVQAI